jgi:hypothetical protein
MIRIIARGAEFDMLSAAVATWPTFVNAKAKIAATAT